MPYEEELNHDLKVYFVLPFLAVVGVCILFVSYVCVLGWVRG